MKKEILIGFVIGLVATAFGFYLYIEFVSSYSFDETLKSLEQDFWANFDLRLRHALDRQVNAANSDSTILAFGFVRASPFLIFSFFFIKKKEHLGGGKSKTG